MDTPFVDTPFGPTRLLKIRPPRPVVSNQGAKSGCVINFLTHSSSLLGLLYDKVYATTMCTGLVEDVDINLRKQH